MKTVVIESPFKTNKYSTQEEHEIYLKRCVLDCLTKNESPYASHAFFTQFLDDTISEQRQLGIDAGLAWCNNVDKIVVYTDYGITEGMNYALVEHISNEKTIEFRMIGKNNETENRI